jgi:ankyrin repeat protein
MSFGTSPVPQAAIRFLTKAIELEHSIAKLFGEHLLRGIEGGGRAETSIRIVNTREDYTNSVIRGFLAERLDIKSVELHDNDGALLVGPEKFRNYAALKVFLLSLNETQREKTTRTYVITMPFSIRMDILSLAIAMDDVTVQNYAKIFIRGKVTTPHDETALIQACRRGNIDIVLALLDAGADPLKTTEEGSSVYHWLFMLGERMDLVVEKLFSVSSNSKNELLDQQCSHTYTLHPQWPLRLHGTPLAFAIESNSITAVKALLKLGASPVAPVYGHEPTTSSGIEWTPIHLAFKYHQADIIRLLLKDTSPLLKIKSGHEVDSIELARSISYSTPVERIAMHGVERNTALIDTLMMIDPEVLRSASQDGQTPLMQAIDFSNLDVVQAMIAAEPALVKMIFADPNDEKIFTYPAIFAAQIAAKRDSSDAFDIVKLLLKRVPKGTKLKDSEGRTPLVRSYRSLNIPFCDLAQTL